VTENGGWWPHVHVQVICDLFGRSGNFQGVARPNERDVMLSVVPDPSPLLGLDASARASRPPSVASLLERRANLVGPSLSVSYRRPLHIVRGVMQYLIDADGRRYLDAVNNVAHVGHAHPLCAPDSVRWRRSTRTPVTCTPFGYAERLTHTAEPLRVCYFVNSGSRRTGWLSGWRIYRRARDRRRIRISAHHDAGRRESYKFDGRVA
jgi:hypothetical protein